MLKVILPAVVSFTVGIGVTPVISHYLYKYKAWKKKGGKIALDGTQAVEFNKLHKEKETGTPRMGGLVFITSSLITIMGIFLISIVLPGENIQKLNFLSRNQTLIPIMTLFVGAVVGFIDDFLQIRNADGLSLKRRLLFVTLLSLFIGWWFYTKLDINTINIPFGSELYIGWGTIPLFVTVALALYASGIIDGIDGLSGGVFGIIFFSYAIIALNHGQIDIAALCAMLVGGILAFLWFNIPPARFYMTETGSMALTLTLATIAFMTDSLGGGIGLSLLPIIGFLLVATVATTIMQVLSKKFLHKKIFKVAPLHHHFEAIGWPAYKVVMRYWILGTIFAFTGIIISLIG